MYSVLAILIVALVALRLWDERADRLEWARLIASRPEAPAIYDPAMVVDLPELARRFFNFAIKPGTPLLTVAEIDMGGDSDHNRAAYGRYVAEAVFWTPAAVLPGLGVVWEELGGDTARVTVTQNNLSQTVDAGGRPDVVQFMRWSNANPERTHRLQPFGGKLSDFREVQGFRIPFNVEAAKMFATDEHFVFFKARVTAVRFCREK